MGKAKESLGNFICSQIFDYRNKLEQAYEVKTVWEARKRADDREKLPVLPAFNVTYTRACADIEQIKKSIEMLQFMYTKYIVPSSDFAGNKISKSQFGEYLRIHRSDEKLSVGKFKLSSPDEVTYMIEHYAELSYIYKDLVEEM